MSKLFGHIRQMAFVVENIDGAMEYWVNTLGIGPFFIKRKIEFQDYRYRGENCQSPQVSIALANSGSVQIELIQQHDANPSIYREFLDNGRAGLQHVSSWETCAGFDERKHELVNKGYTLAQDCTIPSSGVRLAYFDTELDSNGIIFEIADLLDPIHYARIKNIAELAENWNGDDPVREVLK